MIKLKNISKSFNGKTVLNDFSCELPEVGLIGVSGASGSGKTTLARIIAGLTAPDSGTVEGIEKKKIAFVFQEDRLFEHLSALDNVALVADRDASERYLCRFGLENDFNKKPSELSGGMRRRVALARALAYGGDLIILDEPFKGLDDEMKQTVFSAVEEYSQNAAVILISHDLADFEKAKLVINI